MKLYNLTEVRKELQAVLGVKMTYATLHSWVRKGFINSEIKTQYGKREYALYTMEEIERFIENYPVLKEKKLIKTSYKRRK